MNRAGMVVAVCASLTASALGGGTLTSGDAVLTYVDTPMFSSTLGNGTLLTDGAATDQLYKHTWYYRTQNNNQNRVFSSLDTPATSFVGDTCAMTYTNAGPGAAGQFGERFDATFKIQLIDGGNPGEVQVWTTLRFKASAGNASAKTYQIFHLVDLDLAGGSPTPSTDDVLSVDDANEVMLSQTEISSNRRAWFYGRSPSRYEINSGSTLRNKLASGANNLANLAGTTASIVGGDVAAAFQWEFTLEPGQEVVIESAYTINSTICRGDFNHDGFADAIDYDQFVAAWLAGDLAADFNGDTFSDAIDYDQFIAEWLTPC